jgi:hypothetical protein
MTPRLRSPFSATARERLRLRLWAGLLSGLALTAAVLYISVLDALRPASFAVPAATYVCLSATVAWGFMVFSLSAGYRPRPGWHLLNGALFGSASGVLILCSALVRWHLALPAAAAMAVCATLFSASFAAIWSSRSARRSLAWSARRPADRRAARDTYHASRHAMSSRHLSAEEQKVARLNMARAAIAQSRGDDAPDGLVMAAEELHDLLDDPPDDWLMLLGAAVDLVDAMSVRAGKHGDLGGYPKALQLLAAAADRVPADMGAAAVVHQHRADYHAAIADRLTPGPEAAAHADEAITNLCAAIDAVTPALRGMLPELYATLGIFVAHVRANPDDLAAGIEHCRTAVRLAGRRPRACARPKQALATLLIDQALEIAERLSPDSSPAELAAAAAAVRATLAEAERLLRYARRHGGFDNRAAVMELAAQARAARASILDGPDGDQQAARAWRAAACAAASADPLDRVRIGQDWVAWAGSTQNVTWCAEAYAYLVSVVPPAVAVRYLTDERDRMLSGLQATAEEAGYWLGEAGRIGDAAIALEMGRAVSLSETMGRERSDLPAALIQAGREDLLERYRAALSEYGAAAAPVPEANLSSAPQRAWARYDAVVRDIAAVVDIDVPGVPPRLEELTMAARDGPVVYLAAAARSGYAITVSAARPPVYRPLPGLAKAGVAEQVESFLRGAGRAEVEAVVRAEVEAVVRWLWQGGICALTQDLPAGALVTVIPVGLLSLLPVHAAGGPTAAGQAPADWTYLSDLVTVRYAHNARTLLRARDRAGKFPPATLALLAVAAPDVAGKQPLPAALREVARIARQWARADTITDGPPGRVEEMLMNHNVWHFACHCDVTPDSILDSALSLTGAQLSLRAILALPPMPRRLAVLSSCETHLSGTQLPNEAMGLPAGLLQTGFAGVVASHWRVLDRSTAHFMIRFHELWCGHGLSPAAALAETQRWLRTATPAELNASLDVIPDRPANGSAEQTRVRAAGKYGHPYYWAAFALTGQ